MQVLEVKNKGRTLWVNMGNYYRTRAISAIIEIVLIFFENYELYI